MITKFRAVKISSTVRQGIWKEKKRNSDVYQAECRKVNAGYYHTIEKAKSVKSQKTIRTNRALMFAKIDEKKPKDNKHTLKTILKKLLVRR